MIALNLRFSLAILIICRDVAVNAKKVRIEKKIVRKLRVRPGNDLYCIKRDIHINSYT